ncbi:MAG: OmpW family outer membrane protein [Candidatus Aminicenantia bacterium]
MKEERKRSWVKSVFSAIFVLLLIPFISKAQELTFGLGLKIEYATPLEKIYGSGFMSGLSFSFTIGNNFALEIDSGNWKSEVEEKEGGLYQGKLSITPVLFTGQFLIPVGRSFIPYLGIGFGYYFNHFNLSEEIITIPEVKINQEVEDIFGIHFGGGFDYFFTENMALNGDVKYCLIKPQGITSIIDMNTRVTKEYFDINLKTILFKIGVKIYF